MLNAALIGNVAVARSEITAELIANALYNTGQNNDQPGDYNCGVSGTLNVIVNGLTTSIAPKDCVVLVGAD